ncbi:conserved membrane protein [Aspergillus sp. HF37]|nr:conserved membrane protein [Aspergillus sp. HF37]
MTSHFLAPDADTSDPEDVVFLAVRFSASIPDLPLDISSPETTTTAGLKQLVRTRLPRELSAHRLRLIYAGRALDDAVPLAVSLKLPPSPARTPSFADDADGGGTPNLKGKGKEPVRERPRVYIHCSIGDIVLSEAELAAESTISSTLHQRQKHPDEENQKQKQQPLPSTTPAPRGFDRLLSTGFTAAEVSALRSQFLAVQSVTRTRDTMPSGAELRDLEDRWMDEGSTATSAGGDSGGGVAPADDDGGFFGPGSRGAVDDMLWGAVMGFFWPVGCTMWLRREDGVWSWRKGLAVFVGVIVNAAFGAMRILN